MSTTSQPDTTAVAELKAAHRATWATGDYAEVAKLIERVPSEHVLPAIGVEPGTRLLDVATGTGNLALRAAAAGAQVTGLDLVPNLLDVARERAAQAGLDVDWVAGDAEALPFENASFDRVTSVFGTQFAPRHQVVADELVRVCAPGGRIGLVNWAADGLIGRMFKVMGGHMPAPPAFASPPPAWGDEEHVRGLFAPHAGVDVRFERGTQPFTFPSVEAYMAYFEDHYGPTIKARAALTASGRWEQCRAELRSLYEELNQATDGSLHIEADYVVTIAERAA
jgi:SAM-dependent methyltransferase